MEELDAMNPAMVSFAAGDAATVERMNRLRDATDTRRQANEVIARGLLFPIITLEGTDSHDSATQNLSPGVIWIDVRTL